MYRELGYWERTNGLVMLLIVAFVVLTTAALFRPHRPSPFTEAGGYGAGWGTESIMFGGGAKRAAAH